MASHFNSRTPTFSVSSYANAQRSPILRAFCESTFGVVLRVTKEESPSVPHCRLVTEQAPIVASKRTSGICTGIRLIYDLSIIYIMRMFSLLIQEVYLVSC